MRIVVDMALCDGNGLCAVEAPTLLAMGDNDELLIRKEHFEENERGPAERAVKICPKAALSIAD
jgi:ferredoxin